MLSDKYIYDIVLMPKINCICSYGCRLQVISYRLQVINYRLVKSLILVPYPLSLVPVVNIFFS